MKHKSCFITFYKFSVTDEEVTEKPAVVLAPEDETPDFSGKLDAIKAILAQTAQGGQS